jgi:two-component system, cell cycle response regulator DivK
MSDMTTWTVVLVDDEPDSLDLVHDILTLNGVRVYRAANGAEGLTLLESVEPTLVVLDLNMPEPDGWDMLYSIRADPALAGVPVVAITAYYSDAVEQQAAAAGFDAFFPKPIKSGDFMRHLLALLS